MKTEADECVNERCWVLVGQRRGRIWYARKWGEFDGKPTEVEFDAATVLDREERRRDVLGFLHTHPNSAPRPSRRDLHTMRAWASCFGKPLLCLIDGSGQLEGYRFDDDSSSGERMLSVESFRRGIVIAVDAD